MCTPIISSRLHYHKLIMKLSLFILSLSTAVFGQVVDDCEVGKDYCGRDLNNMVVDGIQST